MEHDAERRLQFVSPSHQCVASSSGRVPERISACSVGYENSGALRHDGAVQSGDALNFNKAVRCFGKGKRRWKSCCGGGVRRCASRLATRVKMKLHGCAGEKRTQVLEAGSSCPFPHSAATLWPTADPHHGSNHGEEHQPREDLGQPQWFTSASRTLSMDAD